MGSVDKTLAAVLRGTSDANIGFDDLRRLLLRLGFEERTKGSHHMFWRPGIIDRVNLQRDGNKAKPYQVRQFLKLVERHHLRLEDRP